MKKLSIFISSCVIMCACGNNGQQEQAVQAAAVQAKQTAIDSLNAANEKQKTIDSLKVVVTKDSIAKTEAPKTQVQPVVTTTAEKKKKGWSSTAKGAVIGTGVGAVTGAIVSKHKVGGAVVGGLLGAGAGAGTGAIIDNSKKKKQKKQ